MAGVRMKKYSLLLPILMVLISGCVYYNLFFLAKKNFNEAESMRKRSGQEIVRGGASSRYQTAIEKASAVLELHPNSKYVDDALYMIGRSFYHQGEFSKAETKFRELLATYPKSEYVESSIFYLGKSRYWKEDWIGAREAFERLDSTTDDKNLRSQAMYMLGEILYAQEEYEKSILRFYSCLDEFGKASEAGQTQFKIAQAYYLMGNYSAAKDAYVSVGKYDVEDSLKFRSLYNAGDCYYQLAKPDSGLIIFTELANDEKNYSLMPDILLQTARGQELKGEYDTAIATYRKLIEEYPKTEQSAVSFYQLGLIHQDQLFDLETAKAMYDSSTASRSNTSVSKDAFSRSSDIAKLKSYREGMDADSIGETSESQYLLAELFLTQLNQPDSALHEYQWLIDSFPESKYAPRALLAVGWINEYTYGDTATALSYYHQLLQDYPSCDLVPITLRRLDIDPDSTDYDYPARRYSQGEQILLTTMDYNAANEVFQSIVDDFPESEYVPKAEWAIAWSTSRFQNIADPDSSDSGKLIVDSTFIHAYQRVAELYKDTEYGREAGRLLQGQVSSGAKAHEAEEEVGQDSTLFTEAEFDSVAYQDSVTRAIEEEMNELPLMEKPPTVTGEFVYPITAYNDLWEGSIKFKIKMDFTGKVEDWVILQGSGYEDVDIAAAETLKDTFFNPADVDPLLYGKWFLYVYNIRLPEELRRNLNR